MPDTKTTTDDLAVMIKGGFDDMGKRMDGIEHRMDGIEHRMDKLEVAVEDVKLRLDNVAFRFELQDLEKRVKILEGRA